MKGRFRIDDPDSVVVTLEFTMTIGDWRQLYEHLPDPTPSGGFEDPHVRFTKAVAHLLRKGDRSVREEFATDGWRSPQPADEKGEGPET